MSSTLPVSSYSVVPYSVTSLVTDYLGTKNKEIEEVIHRALCNDPTATLPPGKEVDTLILRIFKEVISVQHNFWSTISFKTRHFVIESNTEELIDSSLHTFKGGININAKKLEVIVEDNLSETELQLSPQIKDKLLEHIINGNQNSQFCCFDFMMFLLGADTSRPLEPPNYSNNRWNLNLFPRREDLLPAQSFVELFTQCTTSVDPMEFGYKPIHQAFYLGHGLYLSTYGLGSNPFLLVMKLEDMKEYWEPKGVCLIRPK